jgi:putative membrane protein
MTALARLGLLIGVGLLVALGERAGWAALGLALVGSAGPIACASAYRFVSLTLNTLGWRSLLPVAQRPRFGSLLCFRWMGEAVNSMLPVAQVGGDVVRAHRLVTAGVPAPDAGASMIGDLTAGVLSQLVFTLLGLVALLWQARVGALWGPTGVGLAVVVLLGLGAATLLRLGVSPFVSRLPIWPAMTARWKGLAGGAARLDAALRALMGRRRALAAALGWHLAGWLSQVGETWIVLTMLGVPRSWAQALVIESLAATARGVAFFVPGGLGVQEATVVGIGRYLGLPAEPALALGLIKRLRELVVGLAGVALWAYTERGVKSGPAPLLDQHTSGEA